MIRSKVRFVLAVLVVAGGLALAPSNAAAAGRESQEPGVWSLALQWVAQVWEENVVKVLEMEGGTNGAQAPTPPEGATGDGDRGWGWDPNG